jgi:biopolymer transport protein TolQ
MSVPFYLMAQADQVELVFIWNQATPEGKGIIVILAFFSIFAWSVMASKVVQMRRAKRLNQLFDAEFRAQPNVMAIFDRRVQVEGCPLFTVYQEGCVELDSRLRRGGGRERREIISLKSMEHVKRALEGAVAREALAVSGAPFLGLLGTVWGVMSAFSYVAMEAVKGGRADLAVMAPGVAAALVTTVAGLLVAIPSMFGYNWLVHSLRVFTVNLDNFAQQLVSKMETEYVYDPEEVLRGREESNVE